MHKRRVPSRRRERPVVVLALPRLRQAHLAQRLRVALLEGQQGVLPVAVVRLALALLELDQRVVLQELGLRARGQRVLERPEPDQRQLVQLALLRPQGRPRVQ